MSDDEDNIVNPIMHTIPRVGVTPVFNEWKKCPECGSGVTRLQVGLRERKDPINSMLQSQRITVYFECDGCGLESEHKWWDSVTNEEGIENAGS